MAETPVTTRLPTPRASGGADAGFAASRPHTKRWLEAIADVAVWPALAWFRLITRLYPERSEMVFQGWSQFFSVRSGISGHFLRRAFYRHTLTRCSSNCWIGFGTTFATPDVEIGEGVSISNYCQFGQVSIGDDALIGSNVHILSGRNQHGIDRLDVPIRLQAGERKRVRIGRDVWIGNNATVLDDVDDQAVVAAGAVVHRRVPARVIVAGNPARRTGERGRPNATIAWRAQTRND